MKQVGILEKYPLSTCLLSGGMTLAIYGLGVYLLGQLGILWGMIYLLFCFYTVFKIIKYSCPDCCYFGKRCGLGLGLLSGLFFEKGDPKKMAERQATWKELIPDMLILLLPLAAGITLLIGKFSWLILSLVVVLVLLSTMGNGALRGNLLCKYCRQRELGCPAEKMFNRKKAG